MTIDLRVGDAITLVVYWGIEHCTVSEFHERYSQFWVVVGSAQHPIEKSDYGVRWLPGHLPLDSDEVKAVLVAQSLLR